MADAAHADIDLLHDLIGRAKTAGTDAADAILVHGTSLSYDQRLGEIEKLEREESADIGLRVLVGKRQAMVSSTDRDGAALDELVTRALAMARTVPEDRYCGLADAADVCGDPVALDMADTVEPDPDHLKTRARDCEDAARAVDGVTNSEGASAGWSLSRASMAASNGFTGSYARSRHSVSASVIAGEGTGMERDYDYSMAVYGADLDDPTQVGRRAGERTVRRVGPRKMPTAQVPVVYEARVAGGLLRHLVGAINGSAIASGTSFLKEMLGQKIFATGINVVDDPLRPRGFRSRPFDGEGIAGVERKLIDDGVLTTWLLDLATARQLGLKSTGHAGRGTGGPPSPGPTNLYLAAGTATPEALMADITSGFYVTELMGMGINMITGDYSRGAAGYWIENGKITFPVSELTVAGNLGDMFRELTPANDLAFRFGTDSPTVRIDGMTVAGTS